jgi:regulator of replication initiation timing
MQLLDQIEVLHKKMNAQVINISNLNGGLMAKIWEGNTLKKENNMLNSKVAQQHWKENHLRWTNVRCCMCFS